MRWVLAMLLQPAAAANWHQTLRMTPCHMCTLISAARPCMLLLARLRHCCPANWLLLLRDCLTCYVCRGAVTAACCFSHGSITHCSLLYMCFSAKKVHQADIACVEHCKMFTSNQVQDQTLQLLTLL
jgi:hypothetical protein